MNTRTIVALYVTLGACIGTAATAEVSLLGQEVTVQVQTYDDLSTPLFWGTQHAAIVESGVEFDLQREGIQNDMDVVPIEIDIGANRIDLRYVFDSDLQLVASQFNGYIFDFGEGACITVEEARVDEGSTTLTFTDDRVSVTDNTVALNISGVTFGRDSQIGVDLRLKECPMS